MRFLFCAPKISSKCFVCAKENSLADAVWDDVMAARIRLLRLTLIRPVLRLSSRLRKLFLSVAVV
jgi:hypothetical protein